MWGCLDRVGVEVGDGQWEPSRVARTPARWVGDEKGTQPNRELLNFVPMNDDDTRRIRLPLQQALLGAVFPLSTEQLVLLARENDAPPIVLSLLSGLPRQRFDSLDLVQRVVEAQLGVGEEAAEAPSAPMQSR